MNFFPSLPPPPQLPPPLSTTINGGVAQLLTQPQLSNTNINPDVIAATSSSPPSSTSSPSSSIIIITIVISAAIILSATIYFILRRLHHPSTPPRSSEDRHVAAGKTQLDSLPLFKFGSVNGKLTGRGGGDCAVCLSKFDSDDQLRLLPLCCHVFHARCIDTWLSHNQTCPLCRSTVYSATSDALNKLPSISRQNLNSNNTNSDSFRIEIGSVSRRRQPPTTTTSDFVDGGGGRRPSYSIGSFEYIVDENFEIPMDVTSAEKEFGGGVVVAPPGEGLAAADYGGSGRNWLKEYVERLGSFAISSSSSSSSFRGSGRVLMGSSRRNDVVVPVDDEDLEANSRVGEEISELFRWISGV